MSDLIKREDAIEALQKEINKGIPPFDDTMGAIRCGVRLARNIIEDLPSADRPQGEWIPCSERLPEEKKGVYLICTEDGYICSCRWTNVNPFWTDLTTEWHWCIFDIPQYSKVVAWMPLKPWKGAGDDL